jgi:glucan phosphoethanolaminetransferase (alkaline phosphatase superfamily)
MTTKPQNLLRSFLLVPYLVWGISLLFAYLVSGPAGNLYTSNAFFDALTGVTSFYAIGIVLWGIPYTILALGLLLWSIRKPVPIIFKVFVLSPLLLSILMVIEIVLISFWPVQVPTAENALDLLKSILVVTIPTLVYGYGFVGAGSVLYKVARRINFISIEGEAK